MSRHDQLFKDLFRALFRDLLQLTDPELAAGLAAEGAIYLDKEVFLDVPEGRRREADLVAEVSDRSEGKKFLIHVEIERRFQSDFGRRLWRYSAQLHLRHPLPVFSLVVFLRGGPAGPAWTSHTERFRGRPVHRFSYLEFGLSKLPAETLVSRPEPLAWALAALARPGPAGRARLKLDLLRKISRAPVGEVRRFLLANCVETYLQLSGRDLQEYLSLRRALDSPEVEAMEMTWADRLSAKYREQYKEHYREFYREQYREEGLESGLQKGLQTGLERLRRTV
ncbi:MAG TPA: hypothetical protein VGS22_06135, partial [Thermoanaerobaculia bacterium]|nr:hypothetical protein [Thermoanaerobaculia bacterium]